MRLEVTVRKFLVILAVGVLVGCASAARSEAPVSDAASSSEPPAEALAAVAQAQFHLEQGDIEQGVKLFRKAVKLDPHSSVLAEEFGMAMARIGLTDDAVTQLERASSLSPSGEATLGLLLAQAAQTPNDLEKAIGHLEKGVDAQPEGPHARLVLARALIRMGRGEQAWKALQPMMEAHGHDPRVELLAGQALHEAGRLDEAITYLKRAQASPETQQPATLELVETLASARRYKEAADLLGAFLKTQGPTLAGMGRYATLLARAGEKDKALQVVDQVLEKDPNFRDAVLLKALLEASDGKLEQAERLYRKALALEPKDPDAALGLARVLMDLRRLPEARSLLDGLWAQLGPSGPAHDESAATTIAQEGATLELVDQNAGAAKVWLDRLPAGKLDRRTVALWGEYFRQRKAFAEGLRWLGSAEVVDDAGARTLRESLIGEFRLMTGDEAGAARVLDPLLAGDQDAVLSGIGALQRAKRYQQAVDATRAAIARLKASPDLRFALGASLERAGHWDEAAKEFRALIAAKPDDAAALNYLGYMLADRNVQLQDALAMVQRAVNLEPNTGAYLDSLGWVYFRLGELDRAEKYLTEAVRLDPHDAAVHEHLGDLYRSQERNAKAAEAYRQALTMNMEEEGQRQRIEGKLAALKGDAKAP